MNRAWNVIHGVVVFLCVSFALFAVEAMAGRPKVFVSILPQAYFVERIGGPHVDVGVLVGPGMSPHTYEPTPRQMAALGEANIFFRIGLPFEDRILEKIGGTMRDLRIVDTRLGVPLRYFEAPFHRDRETGDDDHRHGQSSSGETADPHLWLDPKRVMIQARTICQALVELDPERENLYRANLVSFLEDLERIDRELTEILAPLKGKTFYAFHPAFGYFADSYGLHQESVEVSGKEPSPRQLASIIEKAKEEGVRVIFVQPQFSPRLAESVAREIGGAVVPLDPLARDYLLNLERIGEAISKALAVGGGERREGA